MKPESSALPGLSNLNEEIGGALPLVYSYIQTFGGPVMNVELKYCSM
jgi:hypothetical protein